MKKAYIFGAGSYVIGDSFGMGVVLPSLIQLHKEKKISEIVIAVRTDRTDDFWVKVDEVRCLLDGDGSSISQLIITELGELNSIDFSDSIAFVCIPDYVHYDYARILIEKKVPTWIVKPLSGNGKESRKLSIQASKSQTPLWVDYHKRFDPSNRRIKRVIDEKTYGNMLIYSVQYSQPGSIPLIDLVAWANKVDVFQYIGCHYLDQIFFLYPDCTPVKVSASGHRGRLNRVDGPEFDIITAIIDYELSDGQSLRGIFVVGWNDPEGSPAKSHQRIDLQFENGRIIADQKNRGHQEWDEKNYNDINPNFFQLFGDRNYSGLEPVGYGVDSIRHFVDHVESGSTRYNETDPWAWNTYQTDVILDAIKLSLVNNGEWTQLEVDSKI